MTPLPQPASDEPTDALALPKLYNLVCCSCAADSVDDAVVAAHIIASAKRRNPAWGITGLLVFGSGVFFQWLEGPRTRVEQLMTPLRSDPRHDNVVALSENEEVRERLFPDWDMELVTADHICDVLTEALDSATDERSTAVLTQLLAQLDAGPLADLAERTPVGLNGHRDACRGSQTGRQQSLRLTACESQQAGQVRPFDS